MSHDSKPAPPPASAARAAPPPLSVRLGRWGRIAIKRSVWTLLCTGLARLGRPLETVQVLVVDPAADAVLLLKTEESPTGYFPVQGLRKGFRWWPPGVMPGPDPRTDAQAELGEEAVENVPDLSRFELIHRYREGVNGQFDCRVYRVEANRADIRLRPETAEGLPLWVPIRDARALLEGPLPDLLGRR